MKYILLFVLGAILFSCNNQRILLLPEVEDTQIREVLDVSTAYIFYDETQPDSTLFNRKNLIGTTNWLVNVDKRLTLKQAITHIQYLQNKRKKASMYKNESAKNYFICNDKSIENLGFIEFTDIQFNEKNPCLMNYTIENPNSYELIEFKLDKTFSVKRIYNDTVTELIQNYKLDQFYNIISLIENEKADEVLLLFDKGISFQDYITIKQLIEKNISQKISKQEFFF